MLEFDTVLGGHLTLKQSTTLPVPFAKTAAIVTLANPSRIVVAHNGVWSSQIPQPTTNLSGYDWQLAQGLPGIANYSGFAAAPGASVVVAEYGRPLDSGLKSGAVIYRGTFQGDVLVFTESQVEGVDLNLMRRPSLASCEDRRDRMYAVGAAADGTILAVLSSRDGG